MSTTAVMIMIAICSFVWGGFAAFLIRAVRHEGAKRRSAAGR